MQPTEATSPKTIGECPVHGCAESGGATHPHYSTKEIRSYPTLHVYIVSPCEKAPGQKTGHSFMTPGTLGVLKTYVDLIPSSPLIKLGPTTYRLVTKVYDERTERRPFRTSKVKDNSIVLLSVLSTGADRAMEIAKECASNGIRLICGGYHPSALPYHLLESANIVWVGAVTQRELLQAMETLLQRDASTHEIMKNGPLEPVFHQPAAYNGIYTDNCLGNCTNATAGCPVQCSFCGAVLIGGNRLRTACPDCLDWTLRQLPRIGFGPFGWIFRRKVPVIRSDDNALQNTTPKCILHFLESSAQIHSHGLTWVAELCAMTLIGCKKKILDMAALKDDPRAELCADWQAILAILEPYGYDLYRYIAEMGGIVLYFGIEELVHEKDLPDARARGLKKLVSMEQLRTLIDELHQFHISVAGAFVLGLPSYEGRKTIDAIARFVTETGMDAAQYSIATPTPGSNDFWKAALSGDILTYMFRLYDCSRAILRSLLSRCPLIDEELQALYNMTYSLRGIFERLPVRLLFCRDKPTRMRIWQVLFVNLVIHFGRISFLKRWEKREVIPDTPPPVPDYVLKSYEWHQANASTPQKLITIG